MEWIRVKDRLPEIGVKVLCYCESEDAEIKMAGPYFVCEYINNIDLELDWDIVNDTYPNSSNYTGFSPTHWMPLPLSPKEE